VPERVVELCQQLTNLNLSRNENFSQLPDDLFLHKGMVLQTLFLNSCKLKTVPDMSLLSECLTCLSVQKNQLKEIPEPVLRLASLR
jgi:hypothetical protein